ncbi:MAG: antitoxin MazE family protein [Chlorobaculum sp.]|nr:antitoxin MazE family protein [Chlorobaculum sp.]
MKIVSERVKQHREKLRQSGLRPVQLWVPDTRRPGFELECRRQSNLLKGDAQEKEMLEFLEEAADREGWKA